MGPVSAVPPLTVWPQQKSRRGSSSWKEGGTSAVSRLLAAGQQDGSTMCSGSFSFIVRWSYNSFLPSMTQYFEVSAIKNVGAACPVCDPVANIYGPVHDGCGPSLPSCPAFKVRGLGGRSAPLLRGPSQRNRTDLRCPGVGCWRAWPGPPNLASCFAPGQGSGHRLWPLGGVPALRASALHTLTHSGFLRALCPQPPGGSGHLPSPWGQQAQREDQGLRPR